MSEAEEKTKFVVLDTEGSGLFDYKLPADAPGQPRLAGLTMLFCDENLMVLSTYSTLIKPDGWVLSAGAAAVNGLTMEELTTKGVPVAEALAIYARAIDDGYAIAAFNAQHDCKTMRAELRLAGIPDRFEATKNFCAMRASMGIVKKLNGKGGWPALKDACAHFSIEQNGAHTSLGDALAALEVIRHLKLIGRSIKPTIHYAKEKPEGASPNPPKAANAADAF